MKDWYNHNQIIEMTKEWIENETNTEYRGGTRRLLVLYNKIQKIIETNKLLKTFTLHDSIGNKLYIKKHKL